MKSEVRRSCPPSPSPPPETFNTPYIRDEKHWEAYDELIVIKCSQNTSRVWRNLLGGSPLFAALIEGSTSFKVFDGQAFRIVDITEHYDDVEGFSLLLDALDSR